MEKFDLNKYLMAFRDYEGRGFEDEKGYRSAYVVVPRIVCNDGFSISVQANSAAYCYPRISSGPWCEVECGFPSAAPDGIIQYAESPESPTDTVYGYVPIELIDDLLVAHGGVSQETIDVMDEALKLARGEK